MNEETQVKQLDEKECQTDETGPTIVVETEYTTEFIDPNTHLASITVSLSDTFKQLIQLCD